MILRNFYGKCFLIIAVIITATGIGCVPDKPKPKEEEPIQNGRRVFIANEGSLGNGNASLSVYLPDSNKLYNDVFNEINGMPTGDILQSISLIDEKLYLAVNNSDKILVLDSKTYQLLQTINVPKPRYILKVSNSKAYITSIFHPKIFILDIPSGQITDEIITDYPNTEQMIFLNQKVYVCNWDTACNYLYEINPETDEITDRITLAGHAPHAIVTDKNNKLWVLAGNTEKQKPTTLTQINPMTKETERQINFPEKAEAIKAVFNPTKDTLYFIGVNYYGSTDFNGIYRLSIKETQIPSTPFLQAKTLQYFWGLGIDPKTGYIYIGDPKGFIQKGNIHIYSSNGTLINTLSVDIGPSYFIFE